MSKRRTKGIQEITDPFELALHRERFYDPHVGKVVYARVSFDSLFKAMSEAYLDNLVKSMSRETALLRLLEK